VSTVRTDVTGRGETWYHRHPVRRSRARARVAWRGWAQYRQHRDIAGPVGGYVARLFVWPSARWGAVGRRPVRCGAGTGRSSSSARSWDPAILGLGLFPACARR